MNESERLMEWMGAKGFDYNTLAAATGDNYSTVYMITRGGRRVNDAFKWRFTLAFGIEESRKVFDMVADLVTA